MSCVSQKRLHQFHCLPQEFSASCVYFPVVNETVDFPVKSTAAAVWLFRECVTDLHP